MNQEELLEYNIKFVESAIPGIEKKCGATKPQLAKFLDASIPTVNRAMKSGSNEIPDWIKGKGTNSRVYWPLINIALWMTNNTFTSNMGT